MARWAAGCGAWARGRRTRWRAVAPARWEDRASLSAAPGLVEVEVLAADSTIRMAAPGSVLVYEERVGRGRVIAFTEDVDFRAYNRGLNRLFLNAVVVGPSGS